MEVPEYMVGSSSSSPAEGRRKAQSVGLRHAYRLGDEQTLCGLTVRYLYTVDNEKWTARTPQRCSKCADAVVENSSGR
jgi:hypothetical protein